MTCRVSKWISSILGPPSFCLWRLLILAFCRQAREPRQRQTHQGILAFPDFRPSDLPYAYAYRVHIFYSQIFVDRSGIPRTQFPIAANATIVPPCQSFPVWYTLLRSPSPLPLSCDYYSPATTYVSSIVYCAHFFFLFTTLKNNQMISPALYGVGGLHPLSCWHAFFGGWQALCTLLTGFVIH